MRTTRKADGRPSFQFYPDDWTGEPALRVCHLEDRGLWMDMLCIMWKSARRGFLEIGGSRVEAEALARVVGASEAEVKQSLSRMLAAGVYETDEDGTIYCRRMVRDEKQRLSKVEAGRAGGMASRRQADTQAKGGSSSSASSPTPTPAPLPEAGELREPPISSTEAMDLARKLQEAVKKATGGKGRLGPLFHDADQIKLLMAESEYTAEDVAGMIDFLGGDSFWRGIVTTGRKLREHANALHAKRTGDQASSDAAWEQAERELREEGLIK